MKHCLGRGEVRGISSKEDFRFSILLQSMSITLNMGSQSAEASLVLLTSST